jgi:hypothetical protein
MAASEKMGFFKISCPACDYTMMATYDSKQANGRFWKRH